MKIRKAVIPAAGLGTRFLPATKSQPKEMLPIVDKPTLQYIIEECVASGIEEILIITGRSKKSIEDHFDKSVELELELEKSGKTEMLQMVRDISDMVNIHYIRQKEPKGLGHAIRCAKSFVGNEPFAVLLGDDIVHSDTPCIGQLIESYYKHETSILGVQSVPNSEVNKYGIIEYDRIYNEVSRDMIVVNIVEKPEVGSIMSNTAVLGRYILTPDIFEYLDNTTPGKGGEIQLTDAIKSMLSTRTVIGHLFEGTRYDVGSKLGFLQATVEYALRRPDLSAPFREYLGTIL